MIIHGQNVQKNICAYTISLHKMKILPVIVIYEKDWRKCNIYQSLFSKLEIEILIYDNSSNCANKKYEDQLTHYHHDPSNPGVSKAYNNSAKWARQHGFSHLALFDDDTILPSTYIDYLYEALKQEPKINVFVPLLKYNNGRKIFSPKRNLLQRCTSVKDLRYPGINRLHDFLPVNSGSCINLDSFFSVSGYNENIPLDFADYDFFIRLNKNVDSFYLLDCIGEQPFSNSETDPKKLLRRYKYYLEGALHFCKPSAIRLQVLRHTLSLCLRTHKIETLRLYYHYIKHDFSLHRYV